MKIKFEEMVWDALKKIPKGKVTTYKEIGDYLNTKSYRLIGKIVGKNPYAPKVPCHRVVKSDGTIGGYTHPKGVKRKIELLKEEGIEVKDNKIVDFKDVLFKFDKKDIKGE